MGKTRRQRSRFSVGAKPYSEQLVDKINDQLLMQDNAKLTGPVEAARDQLLNQNVEEKLIGLQSLAVLSAHRENVPGICRSDLIRIMAPLLCEPDLPVRNATTGALRNLSLWGPDVCEIFVDNDVLTPLLVLLSQYCMDSNWTPTFDETMGGQMDLRSDTFMQAVNLLWNLCESSPTAVDTFNQTQLLGGMMRCLDFETFGPEISISVAQCVLVVSESNPKSWVILNQHVSSLLRMLEATGAVSHTYLSTLAAGILSNVPALAAAYILPILQSLARTATMEQQEALRLLSTLPIEENSLGHLELDINMDTMTEETEESATQPRQRAAPSASAEAEKNVVYLLDAQRIAAEVITNLCTVEDDELSDTDDIDSDSQSIKDCDSDIMDMESEDKLSSDVVNALREVSLVPKLWQIAKPIPVDLIQKLRENRSHLLLKVKNVRIACVLCLQNLCYVLSTEDLGGDVFIYNMWMDLAQEALRGPRDSSIIEPLTSLMRSSLDHLKTKKELFTKMAPNDLELLIDGVRKSTMTEIRANWLRMLGTLGCFFSEPLVKTVILFLIETCSQEEDVWTMSEGIDALMDMFSDNDWCQIVQETQLVDQVRNLEKALKTKTRQQKKELKDRFPAVQNVRMNFSRFVKYVEKEATKYAGARV